MHQVGDFSQSFFPGITLLLVTRLTTQSYTYNGEASLFHCSQLVNHYTWNFGFLFFVLTTGLGAPSLDAITLMFPTTDMRIYIAEECIPVTGICGVLTTLSFTGYRTVRFNKLSRLLFLIRHIACVMFYVAQS